ncbi:MAG: hypothetical protein LBI70_01265 [Rickettsiales bacterium]|jgi:hypothetical protein|nr:hypothetical protein [Rickettsiales bacterium]
MKKFYGNIIAIVLCLGIVPGTERAQADVSKAAAEGASFCLTKYMGEELCNIGNSTSAARNTTVSTLIGGGSGFVSSIIGDAVGNSQRKGTTTASSSKDNKGGNVFSSSKDSMAEKIAQESEKSLLKFLKEGYFLPGAASGAVYAFTGELMASTNMTTGEKILTANTAAVVTKTATQALISGTGTDFDLVNMAEGISRGMLFDIVYILSYDQMEELRNYLRNYYFPKNATENVEETLTDKVIKGAEKATAGATAAAASYGAGKYIIKPVLNLVRSSLEFLYLCVTAGAGRRQIANMRRH